MLKPIYSMFFFLLSSLCVNLYACDENGKTGIVEKNNLYISVNNFEKSNVTEEQFYNIKDRIGKIYAPLFKARGELLFISAKWTDGTVNASAQKIRKTRYINLFGGLARHEAITPDAFALVVCHELGHHLGGAPKVPGILLDNWASNEGQADYFGTLKCLRNYMAQDDNINLMKSVDLPGIVVDKCQNNFKLPEEVAMCERSSMAGLSLANFFRALRENKTPLQFESPDPAIVAKTIDTHPAPQCRLDTYFNGSICDKLVQDKLSDKDENQGVCAKINGHDTNNGARPLCWFKPKK